MLDLRRDLYARLAISAQKNKGLNTRFRVVHADLPRQKKNVLMPSAPRTIFEERIDSVHSNIAKPSSSNTGMFPVRPIEKIDETVSKIVKNPVLSEIELELEFAEGLLRNVKIAEPDNPKIPIIEKTIFRLNLLLQQKKYM